MNANNTHTAADVISISTRSGEMRRAASATKRSSLPTGRFEREWTATEWLVHWNHLQETACGSYDAQLAYNAYELALNAETERALNLSLPRGVALSTALAALRDAREALIRESEELTRKLRDSIAA